jgi:hypothetical protein
VVNKEEVADNVGKEAAHLWLACADGPGGFMLMLEVRALLSLSTGSQGRKERRQMDIPWGGTETEPATSKAG